MWEVQWEQNKTPKIKKLFYKSHWDIFQTAADLFLRPFGVDEGIDQTV